MEKQQSILVVDDEQLNVTILEELLEDEGYRIIPAYDGETAIKLFAEASPDLVLLDVMMPGIDGYETCRRIRKSESGDTPIIFLSAKAYLDDKLKGYEAGGDDYITKPFTNEELLIKVRLILDKSATMNQLKTSSTEATSLAYQLMDTSAKVGVICRFIGESQRCRDVPSLCALFIKTARDEFGLNGAIRVVTQGKSYLHSDDGVVHTLDKEILESCQPKDRITQFGNNRALFSWGDFSLLVRNLSGDVDTIAILLDGFSNSLNAIQARTEMLHLVAQFHEQNQKLEEQAMALLDSLSDDLRDVFATTGSSSNLSEEEEEALVGVVDRTSDRLHNLLAEGDRMKDQLTAALQQHDIA